MSEMQKLYKLLTKHLLLLHPYMLPQVHKPKAVMSAKYTHMEKK